MSTWVYKEMTINNSTSFVKWKLTSPREASPIVTMTAQPVTGTETHHMGLSDVPAAIVTRWNCVSPLEARLTRNHDS
jgi:hypothetical protein